MFWNQGFIKTDVLVPIANYLYLFAYQRLRSFLIFSTDFVLFYKQNGLQSAVLFFTMGFHNKCNQFLEEICQYFETKLPVIPAELNKKWIKTVFTD